MGVPKQAVKIQGKPMLQRVVDAFLSSRLDEVVVVVRPGLPWKPRPSARLRIVMNPRFEEGISSSVRLGVKATNSESEAVVIGLGDKPLLLPSTIDRIVSTYRRSESKVVVPVLRGVRGNPILFHRSLFPELLRLKGDVGAKAVIKRHSKSVLEVPVEDDGVLVDVDTPRDVRTAEKALAARIR